MLIIRRPDLMPRARISGKLTVLLVVLCLAAAAVFIPVAAHLPHWVEFELVLGAWWFVWAVAMAWLLFHAHVVEHDASPPRRRSHDDAPQSGDGAGCLFSFADVLLWGSPETFGWLVALPFLIIGVVLIVEFLIPGLAFLIYLLVRGMIAKAVNDRHDCRDRPGPALLWGAIWATVYTAPLALTVWGVHALSRHPLR